MGETGLISWPECVWLLTSSRPTDEFETVQWIVFRRLYRVLHQFDCLLLRCGRMIRQTFQRNLLFGHQFAGILVHLGIVNAQTAENGKRFDYWHIRIGERRPIFLCVRQTNKHRRIFSFGCVNKWDWIIRTLLINCTTPITFFCPLKIGMQRTACVCFNSSSTLISGCSLLHWFRSIMLNNCPFDATNWAIWANDEVFKSFMVGRVMFAICPSWPSSNVIVKRAREFFERENERKRRKWQAI